MRGDADAQRLDRLDHRGKVRGHAGHDVELRRKLQRARYVVGVADIGRSCGAVGEAHRERHAERQPIERLTPDAERKRHRGEAIGIELGVKAIGEILLAFVVEERVGLYVGAKRDESVKAVAQISLEDVVHEADDLVCARVAARARALTRLRFEVRVAAHRRTRRRGAPALEPRRRDRRNGAPADVATNGFGDVRGMRAPIERNADRVVENEPPELHSLARARQHRGIEIRRRGARSSRASVEPAAAERRSDELEEGRCLCGRSQEGETRAQHRPRGSSEPDRLGPAPTSRDGSLHVASPFTPHLPHWGQRARSNGSARSRADDRRTPRSVTRDLSSFLQPRAHTRKVKS
jgi:hypothetical protein